jgi:hypothetical protein
MVSGLCPLLKRAPYLAALLVTALMAGGADGGRNHSKLVYPGPDGKLVYKAYTERGDTIPDFSHCGYGGGGAAIPDVPVKLTLQPEAGTKDDLPRLQAAVDQVARMPLEEGFRGAILLKRGTFRLGDSLKVGASGIVIRGEGEHEKGTVLLGTRRKSYPLVSVRGSSRLTEIAASRQKIVSPYVPVGSRYFEVADGSMFKAGDTVLVVRHGNAAWIHEIGMDRIAPRPGNPSSTRQWQPFALNFDRVITAVTGSRITVDAPITCAIDEKWGGGEIVRYEDSGRIERVGVESLRGVSEFDSSKTATAKGKTYFSDEEHASYLVAFENVRNAWARRLAAVFLSHGVASFGGGAKWVTVEDASAVDPVSVITGGRRYPYNISGQLILVQRCYARDARHAFAVGSRVPGPNVFLECKAEQNHSTSEPHHRWSVGGLFDNVAASIAIQDRQYLGSGHGWAGANYVVWNSTGSLVCQQPPTAQNFAIGFVGTKSKGAFERPDGYWESQGRHVEPRSLYRKQLEDRMRQ